MKRVLNFVLSALLLCLLIIVIYVLGSIESEFGLFAGVGLAAWLYTRQKNKVKSNTEKTEDEKKALKESNELGFTSSDLKGILSTVFVYGTSLTLLVVILFTFVYFLLPEKCGDGAPTPYPAICQIVSSLHINLLWIVPVFSLLFALYRNWSKITYSLKHKQKEKPHYIIQIGFAGVLTLVISTVLVGTFYLFVIGDFRSIDGREFLKQANWVNVGFMIFTIGFLSYAFRKGIYRITAVFLLFALITGTGINAWLQYEIRKDGSVAPVAEGQPVSQNKSRNCNEQETIQRVKAASHLIGVFDRRDNFIGHGTGFAMLDSKTPGLILTNYHVIEDSRKVKVWVGYEGKEWMDAEVYAAYPDEDMALIKVDYTFQNAVSLSDSDKLIDAETLYVIGWPNDPTGDATITKGIFSRRIKEDGYELIQTDAPINPGNSGGPLINMCGIVGMNMAKLAWIDDFTPAEGTGYALSANFIEDTIYKKE